MVTGADILAKARSYKGKFHDGPDVPRMTQAIGQTFPEFASYGREANNSTPWCGIFCAYVLSQFGIKPPPTKSGVGYMWVDRWLDFGTKVPVGQEKAGDLALWLNSPHHISFVTGTGRYVGGNQGNAVTEGAYRTPDAIRRPPLTVEKPVAGRQYGITATFFGGSGDPNTSAYDGHLITDDELGVALPYRFKGTRPKVRVFKDGKSVDCAIVDVGPWNINDPYWETGARPQAESGTDNTGRRTNLAGIDLTPAAADAIGLDGKGLVDWEFVGSQPVDDKPEPTSKTIDEALARIDAAVADIRRLADVATQPAPQLDWGKLLQPLLAELAPKLLPMLMPLIVQMLPQLMPYLLDAFFKPRQSVMSNPNVKAGAVGGIGAILGALATQFLQVK